MHNVLMSMSGDIREAIAADGRSLSELSRVTGVDVSILSRFQRRERTMTVESADRLVEVLGLKFRRVPKAKGRKAVR